MVSNESLEDGSESGLIEESRTCLRRREAFAEKNARKYGSKAEIRAADKRWI